MILPKGGKDTKKLVASLLAIAFLTEIVTVTAEYSTKSNLTLDMKQSVSGEGYFMSYKYVRMPNTLGLPGITSNGVEAKDYSHGSGTVDNEAILSAESSDKKEGIDEDYGQDYQEALSCIQLKEDNKMLYSPQAFSFGTGHYAVNPIVYSSLLKEKTWIKNRGSATSMHHEVEYAHGLDKELEIAVKDFISEDDPSVSMMNITEDVSAGRAHIGMLQGDPALVTSEDGDENRLVVRSAWKNPLVELDEDYVGTFHIEKMLNLTASVDTTEEDYDWLPCCTGGWDSMSTKDKDGFGASTNGIFDCTCYKAPEKAQLPRVTEY